MHPKDIVHKLHDLLAEGEKLAAGFRQVGELNDAFVSGDQYGGITYKNSQTVVVRDQWFDDEDVPRVHVNVLGNLVSTLVSLLTKGRPSAVARALNEDSPEEVYEAEVANGVIRYLAQELKTVENVQKALRLAVTHGSGGIKVWFDAKKREAQIAPVSLFNVTLDPSAESASEAQWFIFHRWLRCAEAERLMEGAGLKKRAKESKYRTASGIEKTGVRSYELWLRPGADADYPKGLYAFVVDDVVIEQTPYPLMARSEAGEESLPPLVWIVSRHVDECVYGRTPVTDCVPIQRTLNETFSRTLKYLRLNSSPKLVRPGGLGEGVNPYVDAEIEFPMNEQGVAAAGAMKWMAGPPIPKEAFDLREFCIKQIHDIIGVAPLTAGTETRNVSGKALEEVEGLDTQKNSQTTRSLEVAVLEMYRILLAIVQQFYDDGRKLEIVGGSRAEVMLFRRADIMGKDIRLEPASEFDLMQPTQEKAAMERAQSGLATDGDVRAAGRDPRHAFSRQVAERLVRQVIAGEDVEVSPDDVDLDAVKAVIGKHKHLAMLEGRKADYLALVEFERFLDELAAQGGDRAAPPQPAMPEPAPPLPPSPEGAPQP